LHLKNESVPRSEHCPSSYKSNQLMLYRVIIAGCTETLTKHVSVLCGQNVEFFNLKPDGALSGHKPLSGQPL
jgi:hypothetical protein